LSIPHLAERKGEHRILLNIIPPFTPVTQDFPPDWETFCQKEKDFQQTDSRAHKDRFLWRIA